MLGSYFGGTYFGESFLPIYSAGGDNTTISASTTWARDGSYSLKLTATGAGSVAATTPTGISGVVCVGGTTVRAMAYFHSASTPRASTVAVTFYDSSGAVISTSVSPSVNSTTSGGGTQAFISVESPSSAAFMSLALGGASLGASESLYADCMFLGPGSSTDWTTGGLTPGTTLVTTRSDGQLLRNAGLAGAVPIPSSQALVFYDVETSPGVPYRYSAVVSATDDGYTTSSSSTSGSATVSPTQWDIMDPTDITTGTQIDWAGDSRTFDQPEAQGIFSAFNRTTAIVVRGTMQGPAPTQLVLQFGGDLDEAWQKFKALRQAQKTLQLRGDMPGDFFYVALGPSQPIITNRTSGRTTDPSRNLTIAVSVVDRP